ncbi:copper amine oxidase N-terminal domain-containing protein, partial [Vibrio parahaemolyticus]|nr:copper amine oxidase N-terminal domain-containing protein [Vibrio parahaemolyticus]
TVVTMISNRTMVPIRAIVEAMDGTVEWDGNTQKITLNARGNKVEMWVGKLDIKVNGVNKKMDVAPVIKNGRTYVPVRFSAENLNCKVDWINSTQEAVIVYEE